MIVHFVCVVIPGVQAIRFLGWNLLCQILPFLFLKCAYFEHVHVILSCEFMI